MVVIFSADRFVQVKCRFNGLMWCIGRLNIHSFHKERKMAVPRIGEEERVHLGGFKKKGNCGPEGLQTGSVCGVVTG